MGAVYPLRINSIQANNSNANSLRKNPMSLTLFEFGGVADGSYRMGAVYQTAATGGAHRKTRQQAIGGVLLTGSDVACSNYYG